MKYGHVTVDGPYVGRVRVYLNGQDVTDLCVEADDKRGTAILLCQDEERHRPGTRYPYSTAAHVMPDADDRPCVHTVHGDVIIAPR